MAQILSKLSVVLSDEKKAHAYWGISTMNKMIPNHIRAMNTKPYSSQRQPFIPAQYQIGATNHIQASRYGRTGKNFIKTNLIFVVHNEWKILPFTKQISTKITWKRKLQTFLGPFLHSSLWNWYSFVVSNGKERKKNI